MLLVIDIGNTNITMGLYDENILKGTYRLTTKFQRTSDEYGFVFTAVEGGYTIMQSDGRFLYVADDDYKNFNVSKEPTSGHVWKVEAQSDGTFKITNVLAPKWIQFSSTYSSYGAYRETQDASFLP